MTAEQVTVVVNGESRRMARGASLLEMLEAFELDPRAVVVELNEEIVRRPALAGVRVRDGDTVELVHFVGGG